MQILGNLKISYWGWGQIPNFKIEFNFMIRSESSRNTKKFWLTSDLPPSLHWQIFNPTLKKKMEHTNNVDIIF